MSYIKMVDGFPVEMSPEEIAERQLEESSWLAGEVKRSALAQIKALEETITSRRLREAALTEAGKSWLVEVDSQITVLRALL